MSGSTYPGGGFLGLTGRTPSYLRTHMNKSVRSGSVDPFNSLPIPTNLQVDFLVKYFLVKLVSYSAGIDRSKSWFPYALQSAPMMHSTLAMTAVLWRAEYSGLQRSIQVEGMRQKGEAIREIQAQLAKVSSVNDLENLDFLLSTMSTLAIAAVCDGDLEAAETHLRGVQTFVSSRGGRGSFDEEFILSKSVDLYVVESAP
ncbi:hypothetical protein FSARC_13436 [Fusarium sarcochroum]|uniref:Uncharacterized protein n=1 Tax=Fusarium sarcochroum TaxID=1208366 RepID=A0A8H4T1F2_9HYPO|nr:hypothetical protein FSARC_13436 [Fusarium sarcochroum]